VGGEIVWEYGDPPSDDGTQFPHLYDSLPTSAVIGVERYEMDDSGRYPQLN
jgi:uncharacterized protein (DUF952 family)